MDTEGALFSIDHNVVLLMPALSAIKSAGSLRLSLASISMICYNILCQKYTILKENDGYYFRKRENETVAEKYPESIFLHNWYSYLRSDVLIKMIKKFI